jgi:SP family general alpha glucoside:H+ symporter-like MFS transporter
MAESRPYRIEEAPADPNVLTLTETTVRRASVANPEFANLNRDAKVGAEAEKHMSITQAFKLYPKAVAWSILLSTAIVMEGYDTLLLANFFALPQFNHKYGTYDATTGDYQISAAWRSGLTNGAGVGEILGLFATGIIQDRIGYRKTIMGALFLVICFIFITFFAVNLPMLLVGEILCGIPWGVFQTITTAYASEVCPIQLRAYLTTYVNLCWVFGQLIGSGVLRAMVGNTSTNAYRIPFAIQWMWPPLLLIGVFFAPESPWWLIRHDKLEEAKHSLRRLTSNYDLNFDLDKTLAMMKHTNEIEKEISKGTHYWDCFTGIDLRRTEISSIVWLVQSICGSTFMGYSTVFYEQAGLPTIDAFDMTMAQYALGAIGTVGSWFLMGYVGRRNIYLYGSIILCVLLFTIGMVGIAPLSNHSASWAIGSMLLIFTFVYDLTIGPVCYSLVAELSSTRLRAKTIVIARNLYNIAGIVTNILTNYMLSPTAWNWGAKSAFFWSGSCLLCVVWIFFRLPEPKGRTYGELDILFECKIPARKFKETSADPFRGEYLAAAESNSKTEVYEHKIKSDEV